LWITENSVRIENAGFRSVREISILSTMTPCFMALLALVASTFRTCSAHQVEILALRHQIAVLQQSAPRRLRLRQSDRLLWICWSRFWAGWRRWLRNPEARHNFPARVVELSNIMIVDDNPANLKLLPRCPARDGGLARKFS
jgi:hypothetical protein